MKLSVITPSYNQGHFIGRTIASVLSQQFDGELEYIVVDGGSTDDTVQILERHEGLLKWTSEKDNGLADAVNKGLDKATGEIIGWLNSDDLYRPGTLKRVTDYFTAHPECMWLYGICRIIDENDQEMYKGVTGYKNLLLGKYSYSRLMTENYISQPAVFFRKRLLDEAGSLRSDLRFAMDYDLWLRFGKLYPAHVIHEYISDFRRHKGSLSENYTGRQFAEQYAVARENGATPMQLAVHKFNVQKIIWGYKVLSVLNGRK